MVGITLDSPFQLSFGNLYSLPRIFYILTVEDKGKSFQGYGEASIDFPFCDYDSWDIFTVLRDMSIVGLNLEERHNFLEDILQDTREKSAVAAVNMALDDAYGKMIQKSVGMLYGIKRNKGKILESISFKENPEDLSKSITDVHNRSRVPKIKLGKDLEYDLTIFNWLINNVDLPYAVDFNAAYKLDEAVLLFDKINGLETGHLLFIEQPIIKEEGLGNLIEFANYVKSRGMISYIVADESFITLDDAVICAENNIVLNYKIQKLGGIYQALKIEQKVKEINNLPSLVGGTFPTAIGRTYDYHAASVLETASLPSDGWQPSSEWFKGEKHAITRDFILSLDGCAMPFSEPGLGVGVREDFINAFNVKDPFLEYKKIREDGSGDFIKVVLSKQKGYKDLYEYICRRSIYWNLQNG